MTYFDKDEGSAGGLLFCLSTTPHFRNQWIPALRIKDRQLDALLDNYLNIRRVPLNPFDLALAADYIEENWDRLLSIAETAAGVDPEPLLRRLLDRLRTEWADWQNGVTK